MTGLENNLKYAREAILHTHNVLPHGATNIPDAKFSSFLIEPMRVHAFLRLKLSAFFYPSDFTYNQGIRTIAETAKLYGVGNCDEQSLVAFTYLTDVKKLRKVDLLKVYNGDHVFLVIGRADSSDINDDKTWGDKAVICDPWANYYYPAKYLEHHLRFSLLSNGATAFNPHSQSIRGYGNQKPARDLMENIVSKALAKHEIKRTERKEWAEKQIYNTNHGENAPPCQSRIARVYKNKCRKKASSCFA